LVDSMPRGFKREICARVESNSNGIGSISRAPWQKVGLSTSANSVFLLYIEESLKMYHRLLPFKQKAEPETVKTLTEFLANPPKKLMP